ncbi:hypothetical protein BDP55DRAFT_658439 [Colletotrichum godetiae]|uniref:Uncharacterized protein n=1 Tax=Colletotrichum godetiae TaxID=1209918 RepID=A0AAJ0ATU6_9PEZI|nr:uncharacterized protein BDP55DRAFT_658439 [Colletotrichum godetiae]KAK1688039.1 hypothetical protein BDP55DRAFT_658439 [Colletotrichum godetiae]
MANVKITVKNQSERAQQFLILNEKPTYSESVGRAWTTVWGCSPGTPGRHGTARFSVEEHYYAVCGMTPEALQTNLIVNTSDFDKVNLGTGQEKGSLETLEIQDGGVAFEKGDKRDLDKDGSFGIDITAYDSREYENVFCGLGMKSPTPGEDQEVIPVSVWRPDSNQRYQITPKRIYYISTGHFIPGTVIDLVQLGRAVTIDFAGKKETVATVIYNTESDFLPVKYSFDN